MGTVNITDPYAGIEAGMVNKFLTGGGFDPLTAYRQFVLGQTPQQSTVPQSSGAPTQVSSSDITNAITKALATPSSTPVPNFPAGTFDLTSPDVFIKQALTELTPYYTKLLEETNGDVNLAKSRLEEDYQKGLRYTKEDLTSSLNKLGITFPIEQQQLEDTLNKRGIALTDMGGGKTTYAGGGQPQTEFQALTEDQALRKEAVERTASRATESAGLTRQRGLEDVTRQQQLTQEQLQSQKEQQAVSRAQVYTTAEAAGKSAQAQKAIYDSSYGGGTSGGGSDPYATAFAKTNPGDVGSIKANFPGYAGWNDPNSIIGDFRNTGGRGKL